MHYLMSRHISRKLFSCSIQTVSCRGVLSTCQVTGTSV